MGNAGRQLGRGCAVVGLAIWLVVGSGATPVLALGTLRYESNATFTVDPVGAVHVVTDITVTNTKADSSVAIYYYDKIGLALTANAANVVATRNGQPLSVSIESRNRFYAQATIRLSPTLRSRQTQVVRVAYDIPASGARVPGVNRINAAYMTFVAFAYGDPSLTSVSVRIPENFDVNLEWEDMERTVDAGYEVYTATNIEDPDTWAASVTASDEGALRVDQFTVADHDVEIRSWPDDAVWSDFVKARLTKGIPYLEKLIGSPLPSTQKLSVTETATPYIYGYAGWYQPSDNTIDIGDALDPLVILHETAHAWFNRKEFSQRWVSEGFAEDFGSRAVKGTGGALAQPKKPDADAPGKVTLNEWSDPNFDGDDPDQIEAYAYNASFYVMRAISNEIGANKTAAVVQSALTDHVAYGAHGVADTQTAAFGWQNMLDAFELVGGSKKADGLFRDYVVTDSQRSALADRSDALTTYRALARSGGSWAPPSIVRNRMASWSFSGAETAMATATKVISERDAVVKKLAALKVKLPKSFQTSYERAEATDLPDVLESLQAYGRAVDTVTGARRGANGDRTVWQSIGLLGTNTEQPITDAVSALERNDTATAIRLSQQSIDQINDASSIGTWRSIKGGSAILLFLLILWCCHLVFKQRRDAEAELLAHGAQLHH